MVEVATGEWRPPSEVDEYRLVRRIGHGGMGDVYLAHDTLLDRLVAVKFMQTVSALARKRMLVEARAAARLQHPHVVAVYRVGELDGRPFIVSEFIRGRSLDQHPRPLPWQRVLELAIGLSRGLAAAHRRGVLHRDIKPANVILTDDGDVKLLDFGVAKLTDLAPAGPVKEKIRTDVDALPLGAQQPVSGGDTTQIDLTDNAAVMGRPSHDLTRPGLIVGTPNYVAPEVFGGGEATRRSDVYSMGVLLFELCSGKPPFFGVTTVLSLHIQTNDAPKLRDVAPDVDADFAAIIDRCLARAPEDRFSSADELRDALEQLTPAARSSVMPKGNPYRGLGAFEAEHRGVFFGRAGAIRDVVDRLRTDPFVLVAGDSGVGKSSLCRAGVLPQIEAGSLDDGRTWRAVSVLPGRRPIETLALAVGEVAHLNTARLEHMLRNDPRAFARALHQHRHGIVVFIDQLEEVITLASPADAVIVGNALRELTTGVPGLRLLATVRGDYLTRVAAVPGLGDEITRAIYVLHPMREDAIREAIVGPSRAKGYTFESEALVERLVGSAQRADGGMPLLQFALAELWESRDQNAKTITEAALRTIGGVEGALERYADGVVAALADTQRVAARRILTMLVTSHGTRGRLTEQELGPLQAADRAAIDALVRARLLVARDAGNDVTTYEVAHEALLQSWGTLRGWMEEQLEHRVIKQRLELASSEWESSGRSRDALWGRVRLAQAEVLDASVMSALQRQFLAASRRHVQRLRMLRFGAVVGVVALVAGVSTTVRIVYAHRVEREIDQLAREAQRIERTAHSNREALDVLRARTFEQFDQNTEQAESLWDKARSEERRVDHMYGQASELLEQAIHRGGHARTDVRALMAGVIYERTVLADEAHRDEARDELLGRLAVYDDAGKLRARWSQAVRLVVETTPSGLTQPQISLRGARPGAALVIAKQVESIAESIAPGSYILTAEAAGYAATQLPLVAERGGSVHATVPLLRVDQIPRGFAYVPPGDFLFGTSDEPLRKQFYFTAPLHRRRTQGFVIARNETTYADWIEYLEALPPVDSEQRRPRSGAQGTQGWLSLDRSAGGWTLTLRPTTRMFVLSPKQKLVYPDRTALREHDWRLLPVSGISAADAEAYTSWLDRSGRVPGARLCTELEWERAARGADGRQFPGGDQLVDRDANVESTHGADVAARGPDAVGSHLASNSPFGVSDMAGNVWEWTRSTAAGKYVVRGGAYAFAAVASSSSRRELVEPGFRDITLGMRVCASR